MKHRNHCITLCLTALLLLGLLAGPASAAAAKPVLRLRFSAWTLSGEQVTTNVELPEDSEGVTNFELLLDYDRGALEFVSAISQDGTYCMSNDHYKVRANDQKQFPDLEQGKQMLYLSYTEAAVHTQPGALVQLTFHVKQPEVQPVLQTYPLLAARTENKVTTELSCAVQTVPGVAYDGQLASFRQGSKCFLDAAAAVEVPQEQLRIPAGTAKLMAASYDGADRMTGCTIVETWSLEEILKNAAADSHVRVFFVNEKDLPMREPLELQIP